MVVVIINAGSIRRCFENNSGATCEVGRFLCVSNDIDYAQACNIMHAVLKRIDGADIRCMHIDECYIIFGDKVAKIYVEEASGAEYRVLVSVEK